MKTPGFFAEASLFQTGERYRMGCVQNTLASQPNVFPQQISKPECLREWNRCKSDCGGDSECNLLCDFDLWECLRYSRG